jgi:hypothetical protein
MQLLPASSRKPVCRALLAAGVLAALVAQASGQEGGGVLYTFGVDQRLQSQTNPGLATPAAPSETTARTRLSFGAISETRTQRLALTAEATAVAGDVRDTGLVSPAAELSYLLDGARSALTMSAFLRETDVDALDFIAGIDAGGNPILTVAAGSGTQRRTGATVGLEFGRDAPFGGNLSLGLTKTDYTNATDPDLQPNRRTNARLSLRFALTPVTDATAALSTVNVDEVGAPSERSDSLTLGLSRAMPRGALTVNATVSRVPEGTRRSLSFGRSLELPTGALSASLGVSSTAAGGDTSAIGSLDWRKDLPRGAVTLGISRAVTGNIRNEETEITRLTLDLAQDLSPRLGLTANIGLQDSSDALTASTKSANLSAALRYALTEDWGMNLGATHRIREETGTGRARSSNVFVSLSRSFDVRP